MRSRTASCTSSSKGLKPRLVRDSCESSRSVTTNDLEGRQVVLAFFRKFASTDSTVGLQELSTLAAESPPQQQQNYLRCLGDLRVGHPGCLHPDHTVVRA